MLRQPDRVTDEQFVERLSIRDRTTRNYTVLSALFIDRPVVRDAMLTGLPQSRNSDPTKAYLPCLTCSGLGEVAQSKFVDMVIREQISGIGILLPFILHPATTSCSVRRIAAEHPLVTLRTRVEQWALRRPLPPTSSGCDPVDPRNISYLTNWLSIVAKKLESGAGRQYARASYWALAALAKNPALSNNQRSQLADLLSAKQARTFLGGTHKEIISVARTGSGLLTGQLNWSVGSTGDINTVQNRLGVIPSTGVDIHPDDVRLGVFRYLLNPTSRYVVGAAAALAAGLGDSIESWDLALGLLDTMSEQPHTVQDLLTVVRDIMGTSRSSYGGEISLA